MTVKFAYTPDHATHPGCLLQEYIEELDISARELARRCGRSPKLISEVIAGKASIEPETALQLEAVLKVDARLWLNMESDYRLHLARQEDEKRLASFLPWANQFPLSELQSRKRIENFDEAGAKVRELLRFFGVGSKEACDERFSELLCVAYRKSPSFDSDQAALLAWLQIGEIKASQIATDEFNRAKFLEALRRIRQLTLLPVDQYLREIQLDCARAGVAFVLEPPLNKVALSGISRWLSPRKAIIQQSLRHMSNDHFWFTFFHESAHILLHSRKYIFIDGKGIENASTEEEAEANEWASNFLIPRDAMTKFITRSECTESEVRAFAEEQGVAPGIVVGQLQHRKVIGFNQMNRLRERYQWVG